MPGFREDSNSSCLAGSRSQAAGSPSSLQSPLHLWVPNPFFFQSFKKPSSFLNFLENGTSVICTTCTWVCWGKPWPLRTCSECVPMPSAASRGCAASRRQGLKRRWPLGMGGCYPRNPQAQLLKSSHIWGVGGCLKRVDGDHISRHGSLVWGVLAKHSCKVNACQHLWPALVLGCRGRVWGGGEGCSVLPLCFQLWYPCRWLCCC